MAVTISLPIADRKWTEFVRGFKGMYPPDASWEGTGLEWIQSCFEAYARDGYTRGVRELAKGAAVVDADILAE